MPAGAGGSNSCGGGKGWTEHHYVKPQKHLKSLEGQGTPGIGTARGQIHHAVGKGRAGVSPVLAPVRCCPLSHAASRDLVAPPGHPIPASSLQPWLPTCLEPPAGAAI